MRFVVTPPQRITPEALEQAYLSGIDRVAWPVHSRLDGEELILTRSVSESGALHIPWPVEGHGTLALSTGSLVERPAPYQLPLELARGTVGQLCEQMADWKSIGMVVPEAAETRISEAIASLSTAAVSQEDRSASAERAERTIRIALEAAGQLARAYIEQALAVRRRSGARLPTLLVGDLGVSPPDEPTARQFLPAFNAARVPLRWRRIEASEGSYHWDVSDKQIEWCKANKLKACGGPLLQLDGRTVPDWLYLWEGDFDNLLSCVSQFVSATVKRYRGKVDLWLAAGRTNTAETLSLSEEQCLRLTARAFEAARSIDPDTPVVVSIDQPWAECASRREVDFPPLHFADALFRSGSDISGVVLEVNLGYQPGGTLPRTLLEFNRQLDHWSLLGLPLFVSITASSGRSEDPLARRRARPPADSTPRWQQAWIARYLPLFLAKSYVIGVIWNQLRDGEPHDFPHGGLFDAQGRPKPALQTLAAIRKAYLK